MSHKIDRKMGVMAKLPPSEIRRGWEMDLASMRMCLKCGKYLHPSLWEGPCAWDRPGAAKEFRREVLGQLALGRLK